MAQAALRQGILGLAVVTLLGACVDGAGGRETAMPGAARGGSDGTGATVDVEAPEIFQVTDTALWDGRPSLGGIWVASPDADDPERVLIVNTVSGQSVQGALFRRERDNPGPALQMSSDAAEALGILAGQPSEVRVTALRRKEAEVPAEAEVPDEVPDEAAAAETAPAAAGAAATTAALDAADSAAPPAPAGTEDEAVAEDEAAAAAPPARKTWRERRAEARAAREAARAAEAKAAAGAVAGAEAMPEAEGASIGAAALAAIETAPLDPVAPQVAAAEPDPAPEPRKTRRQIRAEREAAEAEAAAAEAEAAAPQVAAPAATSPTAGRTIQIASFALEANARRAVAALAGIGVTAEARPSRSGDRPVWGVVATGDAAMLQSIRAAGFADAFFLQ